MSEGNPVPPTPSDSDGDETQTVPLAFLSQPDDSEQMTTPAVGDIVTMQVEAKVVSIEGDNAVIQPTSINGNDLTEPAGDQGDSDDTAEGLRGMAQDMSTAPVTA